MSYRVLVFLVLNSVLIRGSCQNLADLDKPYLFKRISIPKALIVRSDKLMYGGDIRVGDLNNDGEMDFLVYRNISSVDGGASQPCFLGAFDLEGKILWSTGSGGYQPNRPGPVAIHDIDGDGATEVITFFVDQPEKVNPHSMAGMVVQILDGATGQLEKESKPLELISSEGEGPNWVHQRILIANLTGNPYPQNFIIKLGTKIIAFDHELRVLWTYSNRWDEYANCPAYVPVVGDMDGDRRDEINGGYFVLEHSGEPVWEEKLGKNMDAVAIDYWDDPREKRAFASGYGHVVKKNGEKVLVLGEGQVPHGQELRVGDFDPGLPGNEMAIRYKGHQEDCMLVANTGEILSRFKLNYSPNHTGMETVRWNGSAGPDLLYSGGMLWSGDGKYSVKMDELPPEQGNFRQGWYHSIPANVAGDEREEIIIYNPWDSKIFIFSNGKPDNSSFKGYLATPRQYNVRLLD